MDKKNLAWSALGLILILAGYVYYGEQRPNKNTGDVAGENTKVLVLHLHDPDLADDVLDAITLAQEEDADFSMELKTKKISCNTAETEAEVGTWRNTGIKAVIVSGCSDLVFAASRIADENEIVTISPTETDPGFSENGDFIFRTVPSTALVGSFVSSIIKEAGQDSLAILNDNTTEGIAISESLRQNFLLLEGNIVLEQSMGNAPDELENQIEEIKRSGADSVYLAGEFAGQIKLVVALVASLPYSISIYLPGKLFDAESMSNKSNVNLHAISRGSDDFKRKFFLRYGREPGRLAAQAYDAYKALELAADFGAKTAQGMKDAMYQMQFNGASGLIRFDARGDVAGNYDIWNAGDLQTQKAQ